MHWTDLFPVVSWALHVLLFGLGLREWVLPLSGHYLLPLSDWVICAWTVCTWDVLLWAFLLPLRAFKRPHEAWLVHQAGTSLGGATLLTSLYFYLDADERASFDAERTGQDLWITWFYLTIGISYIYPLAALGAMAYDVFGPQGRTR
jgi:hypothetical protein